jgi:serine/threonine protein kinase
VERWNHFIHFVGGSAPIWKRLDDLQDLHVRLNQLPSCVFTSEVDHCCCGKICRAYKRWLSSDAHNCPDRDRVYPDWLFPSGLSRSVLTLLLWLLNVDPQKRCTATEALSHPWVANVVSSPTHSAQSSGKNQRMANSSSNQDLENMTNVGAQGINSMDMNSLRNAMDGIVESPNAHSANQSAGPATPSALPRPSSSSNITALHAAAPPVNNSGLRVGSPGLSAQASSQRTPTNSPMNTNVASAMTTPQARASVPMPTPIQQPSQVTSVTSPTNSSPPSSPHSQSADSNAANSTSTPPSTLGQQSTGIATTSHTSNYARLNRQHRPLPMLRTTEVERTAIQAQIQAKEAEEASRYHPPYSYGYPAASSSASSSSAADDNVQSPTSSGQPHSSAHHDFNK